MALLPLLVLSAALLKSANSSPDVAPNTVGDTRLSGITPETSLLSGISHIVSGLADACLEGAGRAVTGELKADLQRVQQQVALLESQQEGRLSVVQQQMETVQQQQIKTQQQLQGQLTAVQDQLTAFQERLTASSSTEHCPANWSRRGSSCYLIPRGEANWLEAHHSCSALHPRAGLASIHQENSEHVDKLLNATGLYSVYIGLFRLYATGRWVWTDGTPLDYTNWGPNEPDNRRQIENSVTVDASHGNKWHDRPWTDDRPFLCQISLS